MKKNIAMRLASGLMLSCLLSTCVISGTFAKYMSEATGESAARVAKWSFEVNDANAATTDEFTFDLFESVNDANVKDGGTTENIIAPGTTGSVAIILENTSEVTATYAIEFTESDNTIPMEYSLDNTTWTTNIATLNIASGTTSLAMESGSTTVTLYWRWVFEVDTDQNTADTNLGINGANVTVTAKVTATQVD